MRDIYEIGNTSHKFRKKHLQIIYPQFILRALKNATITKQKKKFRKKEAKGMNGHVTKEDKRMAQKHKKQLNSSSL